MSLTPEQAESCCILKVLAGSHIHGLNVETSDRDEEAICIEPLEQSWGFHNPWEETIHESPEVDVKYVSLRKWCSLATKGNPNFLLPLFAPASHIIKMDARGQQLRDMRESFISRQAIRSHLGYMQGQRTRIMNHQREWEQGSHLSSNEVATKFGAGGGRGKPRFELIEKYGYDTKFAMHLVRLGWQGWELMHTGRVNLPVEEPMRSFLMNIRNGNVPLQEVLDTAEGLEVQMKEQADGLSKLPEDPDYAAVEKFMLKCYIRKWAADRTTLDIKEDRERLASLQRS